MTAGPEEPSWPFSPSIRTNSSRRCAGRGFDDAQAEAVTERIDAANSENLVTKDDLENAVERLELRIATEVYAAVVVGVGSIEALDFLPG